MSNFSYDDFAVLVRTFSQNMLDPNSLRIVPLSTAPSMADAIKGIPTVDLNTANANLPLKKDGKTVVESNVTVQHDSAGYCRLVGHIEATAETAVTTAKAFVLYHLVKDESAEGDKKVEVIAVASLKEGFAIGDVCYPSFTITTVNNYQSVAFNPNAFATVEDLKNINGLDGLHIAFDTASGDLKLLDKDGNVLDQANLPIKADVIIADGEEGYKYVKTDVKQDIHAAEAWMPEGKTAWGAVPEAPYEMQRAALVVEKVSSREFVSGDPGVRLPILTEGVSFAHVEIDGTIYMVAYKDRTTCDLLKVKGGADVPPKLTDAGISDGNVTHGNQPYPIKTDRVNVDVIKVTVKDVETTYVLAEISTQVFQPRDLGGTHSLDSGRIETSEGTSTGGVVGITLDKKSMYTFEEGATPPLEFKDSSGHDVTWLGTKPIPGGYTLKYGLEAFVWTVKDAKAGDKISDPFFKKLNASLLALGFHEGDDIALGTNLATLAPAEGVSPLNGVDADKYMHGKDNKATREREVDAQRANAKEELVAWNAQHPKLTGNPTEGTIIDHTGLDVRHGSITLGCGYVPVGEDGESPKVNYGIQMSDRTERLEFTISHTTGAVQFDENGHATNLTRSTLLSIEAGDYISGAPTCLILAEVSRNPDVVGRPQVYPVRTTTGFEFIHSYTKESGSRVTIHDYRENISAVFNTYNSNPIPAIIEVQAIYTHRDAQSETVPAQQMHTYIGSWTTLQHEGTQAHPCCTFSCNKIEEWMTAVGLAYPNTAEGVQLYVVIRVY